MFQAIKGLFHANSLNPVFLTKIRLAINKVEDIKKKLKFGGMFAVDKVGQGGGLMLLR